jgi:NADP-dependent 3-hydroxy acid dehydrogenase YdfG
MTEVVVVVTRANSGVGKMTAFGLAQTSPGIKVIKQKPIALDDDTLNALADHRTTHDHVDRRPIGPPTDSSRREA